MRWTDEIHIVHGEDAPGTHLTREAKCSILAFSALVIGIVLALAALAGGFR